MPFFRPFLGVLILCLASAPAFGALDMEAGVNELARQIALGMQDASAKKIAIVEFTDLDGGVSALGQFLAEELTTQLFVVSPSQFQVVERRQLMRVIEEQQLSVSGLIDNSALESLGKILGIEALVVGSITDLGNEVKVNARLISVSTARVFAVASAKFPNVGTVRDLISKAGSAGGAAGVRSSSSQKRPAAGRFGDNLLEAEVITLSLSSDKRRLTLTLRIRNVSDVPVALALKTRGNWDGSKIVDDKGSEIVTYEVVGLPFILAGYSSSRGDYGQIDPGSEVAVVHRYKARSQEPISGSLFFFTSEWYMYQENGPAKQISIGIPNITIGK